MTRDEAIKIELKKLTIFDYGSPFTNKLAEANIDALIELGLLKVDEPINNLVELLNINTYENGKLIVYKNDRTKEYELWYHGRCVWEKSN